MKKIVYLASFTDRCSIVLSSRRVVAHSAGGQGASGSPQGRGMGPLKGRRFKLGLFGKGGGGAYVVLAHPLHPPGGEEEVGWGDGAGSWRGDIGGDW